MRPDGLDVLLDPPGAVPTGAGGSAGRAPSIAPIEQTNEAFPESGCGALILGGSHGALAVARSLGRHGIPVWFAADDNMLARLSRFVRKGLSWPGPNSAGAADFLLELGRR